MITLVENVEAGRGLYTANEAAFYARIPLQTVNRWLQGSRTSERVIRPEMWQSKEKFLTFPDFVQTVAIRSLRSSPEISRVPLQKIREAVNVAADRFGVEHPFAREHVTYWDGKNLHIEITKGTLTQITGKSIGQGSFKQIVELYVKDLRFNDDGLADEYKAYTWAGRDVVMNPKVRFGEPMVAASGYTAAALWEACHAEGSIDGAAKAYGISSGEVEAAMRYYDYLQATAA